MSERENPDFLSGIEEPTTDELMFLEEMSKDPDSNRMYSILAQEVETSEDVYAQGEIQLVRMNLDTLLAETPDVDDEMDPQAFD